MVKVQWIPYITVEHFRSCTVGRITIDDWHKQNVCCSDHDINPYISIQELSSSRYAISYQAIKQGHVYVDVAFIALEGDCPNNSAGTCHDFGDDKIGHYLSNKSSSLSAADDLENRSISVSIEDYMTPSVAIYLDIR